MNSTKIYSLLRGMTKQEILKYAQQVCPHGHSYLEHGNCLEKIVNHQEKIGHLDIETGLSFSADYGLVISWCIKDDGGEVLGDYLTPKDFKTKDENYDRRILGTCVEAMGRFDRLIVYWGKDRRHDIPFLRTRALMMGIKFPLWQEQIVNDLYDTVRGKFRFERNSMARACEAFGVPNKAHPIDFKHWKKALVGHDPDSIAYIYEHNKEDVISTEALHHAIRDFSSSPKTSI